MTPFMDDPYEIVNIGMESAFSTDLRYQPHSVLGVKLLIFNFKIQLLNLDIWFCNYLAIVNTKCWTNETKYFFIVASWTLTKFDFNCLVYSDAKSNDNNCKKLKKLITISCRCTTSIYTKAPKQRKKVRINELHFPGNSE